MSTHRHWLHKAALQDNSSQAFKTRQKDWRCYISLRVADEPWKGGFFSSLRSRTTRTVSVQVPPKHRRGFLARSSEQLSASSFQTKMLTRQQSTTQRPRIGAEGTWNHKFWMMPNSLSPCKSNSQFQNQSAPKSSSFNNNPAAFTHTRLSLPA